MKDLTTLDNILITFSNDRFKNQLFNFLSNIHYDHFDKIYVYYNNINPNNIYHYNKISPKIVFVHIITNEFDLQTYSFKQKMINDLINTKGVKGNIVYCDTSITLINPKIIFDIIIKEKLFLVDFSYIGKNYNKIRLVTYINEPFIEKYITNKKYPEEKIKYILNHPIIIGGIYGFSTENHEFIKHLLNYNKEDYANILNFGKFKHKSIDTKHLNLLNNDVSHMHQGSRHEQSYITYLTALHKYKYYSGANFIKEIKPVSSSKNISSSNINMYWIKNDPKNQKTILLSRNCINYNKHMKFVGILLGNAFCLKDINIDEILNNKLFLSISVDISFKYLLKNKIYPSIYCCLDEFLYETNYNDIINLIETSKGLIKEIYLLENFKKYTKKEFENVIYISNHDVEEFTSKTKCPLNSEFYSMYILYNYFSLGCLENLYVSGIDNLEIKFTSESEILDRSKGDICRKLYIKENIKTDPNYFFNYTSKGDKIECRSKFNKSWESIANFFEKQRIKIFNLCVHSNINDFETYDPHQHISHIIVNKTRNYDPIDRFKSLNKFHYSNIIIIDDNFGNNINMNLEKLAKEPLFETRIICFDKNQAANFRNRFRTFLNKMNIIVMYYESFDEILKGKGSLLPLHVLTTGLYVNVIHNNDCNLIKPSDISNYNRKLLGNNLWYSNINYERVKLSFIIPTYNRFENLKRCVDSIINNVDKIKTEIIIINDCSTDESYKTFEKTLNLEYNVKSNIKFIFKNTKVNTKKLYGNGRPGIVRNVGLRYATGLYICFIDDDDFIIKLPENSYDNYINHLEKNKIMFTSAETKRFNFSMNLDVSVKESQNIKKFNTEIHCKYFCGLLNKKGVKVNKFPDVFTSKIINIHNLIATSGCLINKNVLNYVKEFNDKSYGEDWDYWKEILKITHINFDVNYIIGLQTNNIKSHD